jgi:hypothetical protein
MDKVELSALSLITFPRDEAGNRPDRVEILHLEIFVLDLNAELFLHPRYQLHGKQRVDEAEREDVIIFFQFSGLKEARKKCPDFDLRIVHQRQPSLGGAFLKFSALFFEW